MNLTTCPTCGVVVNLDKMREAKNETELATIGYYADDDYALEFFCPCCKQTKYMEK